MSSYDWLRELLATDDGDPGCDATAAALDRYVDLELHGDDPARALPGVAAHLKSCPACRTDHEGLRVASKCFGWPPSD